ncbi:MAG: ATP-binding protein, partial [Steroidobacteraceae bacterium]
GVDEATMADLFNPFFTTKPGGTGLGLSISRSIVRAHGGKLWCSANPGGGARFFFTLPAAPAGGTS